MVPSDVHLYNEQKAAVSGPMQAGSVQSMDLRARVLQLRVGTACAHSGVRV